MCFPVLCKYSGCTTSFATLPPLGSSLLAGHHGHVLVSLNFYFRLRVPVPVTVVIPARSCTPTGDKLFQKLHRNSGTDLWIDPRAFANPRVIFYSGCAVECEHVFSKQVVFIIIRFLDRIGWFLDIFSVKISVINRRNSLQYTTIETKLRGVSSPGLKEVKLILKRLPIFLPFFRTASRKHRFLEL